MDIGKETNFQTIPYEKFTDSSKDDVTAAFVRPPALMLARTGAPKPIEESCRLVYQPLVNIRKW